MITTSYLGNGTPAKIYGVSANGNTMFYGIVEQNERG